MTAEELGATALNDAIEAQRRCIMKKLRVLDALEETLVVEFRTLYVMAFDRDERRRESGETGDARPAPERSTAAGRWRRKRVRAYRTAVAETRVLIDALGNINHRSYLMESVEMLEEHATRRFIAGVGANE